MAKNFEVLAAAYFIGLLLAAFASLKLNSSAVAAILLVAAILSLVLIYCKRQSYLLLVFCSALLLITGVWRWNQAMVIPADDVSKFSGRQVELIAKISNIPSMVLAENGS